MPRPVPPNPYSFGVVRSPNNRFEWNFGKIPSPARATTRLNPQDPETGGRHTQEAVPVLCSWCGHPYWPPWHVIRGTCSDICREAESQYNAERRSKAVLVKAVETALAQEAPSSRLKELLSEIEARIAEDDTAAAAAAGAAGKGTYS